MSISEDFNVEDNNDKKSFSMGKEDILKYLTELNDRLKKDNQHGEIVIFGGATMSLVFSEDRRTRDIDAIYEPKNNINEYAEEIANKYNLPTDWLNDGVKGFIYTVPETAEVDNMSNLRLMTATPEYIFAMKCHSARVFTSDRKDLEILAKHLNITTVEQAVEILEKYIPVKRIENKSYFFLYEIFEE